MDFIQEDSGMAYWKPSTQVAVENLERCGIEGRPLDRHYEWYENGQTSSETLLFGWISQK